MNLKRFIKENIKSILFNFSILLLINIYFLVLNLLKGRMEEIFYLDVILIFIYILAFIIKYGLWKERYSGLYEIIEEGNDININDIGRESLEEEIMAYIINKKDNNYSQVLEIKDTQIKDMEEYISKWVHEIKLPISAISMILERIEDAEINTEIKNEIEKINFLVNSVMYGSRATAAAEDIFISEFKLQDIIRQAIKNNAFMLIRNNIEIKLENLEHYIFTDKKWVLYVLDQLINNSIKYSNENAKIQFYGEESDKYICLNIRDNGIGIAEEDIGRIFNKGFTGTNGRNTRYKSTGMGLYFSKNILDKLGNSFEVYSVKNEYTLFKIKFNKISDFTTITKM
jgi:signal transduction histidine kinase